MGSKDNLSYRIREALKKSGKTQKQVADEIGITAVSMCRYVKGKRVPGAKNLHMLANSLNVCESWLLTGDMPFDTHIEMIIDYTTDGTDYQYCDNKGVLIRCRDCKKLHTVDCPMGLTHGFNPELNDYCSFAIRK